MSVCLSVYSRVYLRNTLLNITIFSVQVMAALIMLLQKSTQQDVGNISLESFKDQICRSRLGRGLAVRAASFGNIGHCICTWRVE